MPQISRVLVLTALKTPTADRDAAAFRPEGAGWALLRSPPLPAPPRLGRAPGQRNAIPWSEFTPNFLASPPLPHSRVSRCSTGVLQPTKAPHVTATDGQAAKPEERSGSPAVPAAPARSRALQRRLRGQGRALPVCAPQTLSFRRAGRLEAARRPAPLPPPRPRPRSRGPPPPRAPLFANSAHMGERGGERGLGSRHLHPGCRGCCPCSEPSNGSGLSSCWLLLVVVCCC